MPHHFITINSQNTTFFSKYKQILDTLYGQKLQTQIMSVIAIKYLTLILGKCYAIKGQWEERL